MKDFYHYHRFKSVYPLRIKSWQSDNSSENLGEFDEQLKKDGIPHFFSYPRCPKINTYVERYNRTIQEEFIDPNLGIIYDKPLFHQRLADYLIFYNTQRPHKSLGLKSPIEYLIENGGMSQKSLTYTYSFNKSVTGKSVNSFTVTGMGIFLLPFKIFDQWRIHPFFLAFKNFTQKNLHYHAIREVDKAKGG